MARGLNHYMRYYLRKTTSWTGHNLSYTSSLPVVKKKYVKCHVAIKILFEFIVLIVTLWPFGIGHNGKMK